MTDAGEGLDERGAAKAAPPSVRASTGVVVIGRNEGERLKACLRSLGPRTGPVVYVDSGSSDASVAFARSLDAEVVELDMSVPFTAARARQAGFDRLMARWPNTEYVQFVDGDCEIVEGWLEVAAAEIMGDKSLGIVTGWRRERHPDASGYNKMCDIEWRAPAGEIAACGGDMLVRVAAYRQAGGFDPSIIAAEDDEFCIRVRKAGYRIRRLPEEMTIHDAAMSRFAEWWKRAVRAGHGFAQVGALHGDYFAAERRRVVIWGGLLPVAAVVLVLINPLLLAPVVGLYLLSYWNARRGLVLSGVAARDAERYARFLTISKFPNFLGMLQYWRRRLTGAGFRIIEYKQGT